MSHFIRSVADHAKFGIRFKLSIFAVHSCVVVFNTFRGGGGGGGGGVGVNSGTEGGHTCVTYFAEEGVFF